MHLLLSVQACYYCEVRIQVSFPSLALLSLVCFRFLHTYIINHYTSPHFNLQILTDFTSVSSSPFCLNWDFNPRPPIKNYWTLMILVRTNLPLFFIVVPLNICIFLSCRPFVDITTLSIGLVGVEVNQYNSWDDGGK